MNDDKRALMISVVSFILLSILTPLVILGYTQDFDETINYFYTSKESEFFLTASLVLHYLFDSITILTVSMFASAYLYLRKRKRDAIMMFSAMSLTAVTVYSLKNTIVRPRPIFNLLQDVGYSYPSGHVTLSMVFLGVLSILLYQKYKKYETRRMISITTGILVGTIGLSRIYLGVHYFTDMLAGLFLGTGVLFLITYLFNKSNIMFSGSSYLLNKRKD